jgi:hypothetical protein
LHLPQSYTDSGFGNFGFNFAIGNGTRRMQGDGVDARRNPSHDDREREQAQRSRHRSAAPD